MLDGVVRFPPDFAEKYRDKGYWEDRTIADQFADVFARWGDKTAIIDGDREISYSQLDERSTHLALTLWDLGLRPLDRVVVQFPNVAEFAYLYFALQKIGVIPIMALPSHRYREVSQFTEIAQARACFVPDRAKDFDFADMVDRVRKEQPSLEFGIVLGGQGRPGFTTMEELLTREPETTEADIANLNIDPEDPAVFQLSGGTTGIPKLIPRTHNDYICNSKLACAVTEVGPEKVLLDILPIEHNLALACPGMQGFLFHGGTVVLDTSVRGETIFPLVEKHRVTHIHVVPALLIRWINDPLIHDYDLSSLEYIQSGGQRLQPEVRRRTKELIPSVFVQENFGMSEGTLMFVRKDDPEDVRMETVGRPVCEDDEVRLVDDDDREVPFGEIGELCVRGPYTLRGYYGVPEHNAKAFSSDGFYRSGDLMRQHHSGNYMVEGRKKDVINRGGEKISAEEVENLILTHPAVQNVACVAMPDPNLGEKMCAYVILRRGETLTFDDLIAHLKEQDIARFKLPERLEVVDEFPLSPFGKVSKKTLVEEISKKLEGEQAGASA